MVAVVDHRPEWPAGFARLARLLDDAPAGEPRLDAVDHVGATSVPGLPAVDCVDIQVRLHALDEERDTALLAAIGFQGF